MLILFRTTPKHGIPVCSNCSLAFKTSRRFVSPDAVTKIEASNYSVMMVASMTIPIGAVSTMT